MNISTNVINAVDQNTSSKIDKITSRPQQENDVAKIKKVASEFESIFLEQMFHSMRSSVQKSGLIDGGNAEEIYTSMLDGEYAKQMSSQGNAGLAQMIEKQLLQSLGVKSDASPLTSKRNLIKAYEQAAGQPLQVSKKEVTIEPRAKNLNVLK